MRLPAGAQRGVKTLSPGVIGSAALSSVMRASAEWSPVILVTSMVAFLGLAHFAGIASINAEGGLGDPGIGPAKGDPIPSGSAGPPT